MTGKGALAVPFIRRIEKCYVRESLWRYRTSAPANPVANRMIVLGSGTSAGGPLHSTPFPFFLLPEDPVPVLEVPPLPFFVFPGSQVGSGGGYSESKPPLLAISP